VQIDTTDPVRLALIHPSGEPVVTVVRPEEPFHPVVAVVGAGGIGSRHLQALVHLGPKARVIAVDPSIAALGTARTRVDEVVSTDRAAVEFAGSLRSLPEELDVVVIATGAAVRRQVVENLLAQHRVGALVLEKFLFQRAVDHTEVGDLLSRSGTSAWVNTARRAWPCYRALAHRFGPGPVSVQVDAPGGLAIGTSAIHFADLLVFLGREPDMEAATSGLQHAESRHAGVVELTGTLRATTPSGSSLRYTCDRTTSARLMVTLTWPSARVVVSELDQLAWTCDEARGGGWRQERFPTLLQSELTHVVVRHLLSRGSCDLTPYEEAVPPHLAILQALSEPLAGRSGPDVLVPIT